MTKETKEGYIVDFISGQEVKATPEETEAVQIFAKQLAEDYNYPKNQIQTRPQFRVKVRPSDNKKEYPVDIAVFLNDKKQEDDIYIIIECKKKNRKDGKSQLQDYLRFSKAFLGVWFNGDERLFLRKIEKNGRIEFEEIPNIPQFGQRFEDIGKFKRKDLKPTHNLKAVFKAVRNHLAANTVGATRDEVLAQQLINLIFCKIYDEKFTKANDIVSFRAGIDENAKDVKKRVLELFAEVKKMYAEVLDKTDDITLDENSITYVVGELQNYCLMEAERDVIADAFETFIGHALKGGQGQFFTPRNVIKMMVEILNPSENDLIIDPACGSGGFLIDSLKHVWDKIDKKGQDYNWSQNEIDKEKQKIASEKFRGIDKDYFLSKVTKAYMTLIGDGTSGVVCDDSLETKHNWNNITNQKIQLDKFDVLLTNPPFGSKIPVRGEEKLKQFELGHKWKLNKKINKWEKGKLKDKESPQVLFVERCLQLLKSGGRMAIVLPEGTFGNPSDRYIWEYLIGNSKIEAIISAPAETFQPNTHFKTSILVLKKEKPIGDYEIFMGIANTCGHNKNGKEIYKVDNKGQTITDEKGNKIIDDEISLIAGEYGKYLENKNFNNSHLGFAMKFSEIKKFIFIPDYYDPDLQKEIIDLQKENFKVSSIQNLIDEKIIKIKRGNEIGSENYGKGDIPFIRTSDIVNWELKVDPVKSVPEIIYDQYKNKQDIKENDILFVKDGTFLIGRTAIITRQDEKIIIQSHLLKIRVADNTEINPYYLLYLLNMSIVQKQIKKYTFIQGTLSSVGDRFNELKLPIHKDKAKINEISRKVENIIIQKQKIKEEISSLLEARY